MCDNKITLSLNAKHEIIKRSLTKGNLRKKERIREFKYWENNYLITLK